MKRLITLFLAVLMVAGLATTAMARGGGCGRGPQLCGCRQ